MSPVVRWWCYRNQRQICYVSHLNRKLFTVFIILHVTCHHDDYTQPENIRGVWIFRILNEAQDTPQVAFRLDGHSVSVLHLLDRASVAPTYIYPYT